MRKLFSLLLFSGFTLALVGCGHHTHNGSSKTKKRADTTISESAQKALDAFYNKALTVNPDGNPAQALAPYLDDNFTSMGSVETENKDQMLGSLDFYWELIPDMKWDVQEILKSGDQYTVRSIASGTPNGDFFGTPTNGTKSFKIMTIDIHTIKNGKITQAYHIEDWATAMGQLAPDTPTEETASTDAQAADTMKIATSFMEAMSKGDIEGMKNLMDEDMVWHNEGDTRLPWIGKWEGRDVILNDFMPTFGANLQTTKWETEDRMAKDDTAAFFGTMAGITPNTNQSTGDFTFGLRVKVKNGKIVLWNWLEDSFAVSQAYNGEKTISLPPTTMSNTDKVTALLNSFNTGDQTPISYINPEKYIQHNLAVGDGLAGFGEVMKNAPEGGFSANVVRAFEDGEYVVTHTEYDFFGPKVGFDIFRFEDGLIVEHWDNLQEIVEKTASGRTQTDGPTEITDLEKTGENKQLVSEFIEKVLIGGQGNLITNYISTEQYDQHNPSVGDGLAAVGAAMQAMAEAGTPMTYTKNHIVLGQGNFVLAVSEGQFMGKPTSFYDLFRIENGKVVEHWDAIEAIPEKSEWKNSNGKFGF